METKNIKEPQEKKPNGWKTLICTFLLLFVLGYFLKDCCSPEYVTQNNYNKIKAGMTYSEVVDIFGGKKGTMQTSASTLDYTVTYYYWEENSGCSTCSIVVGFYNGVVLTKAAEGL